jgi:hypothetical protein
LLYPSLQCRTLSNQVCVFQDLEEIFMDSVRQLLDERFTETLQENYRLLYGFVKANIPQDDVK